jgi:single-strand DNA-binding protein
MNSVTIVGFVGADPEQRQARNNGAKFTVLSVATQRSWKNAQDEWSSKTEWHRVCVYGIGRYVNFGWANVGRTNSRSTDANFTFCALWKKLANPKIKHLDASV